MNLNCKLSERASHYFFYCSRATLLYAQVRSVVLDYNRIKPDLPEPQMQVEWSVTLLYFIVMFNKIKKSAECLRLKFFSFNRAASSTKTVEMFCTVNIQVDYLYKLKATKFQGLIILRGKSHNTVQFFLLCYSNKKIVLSER